MPINYHIEGKSHLSQQAFDEIGQAISSQLSLDREISVGLSFVGSAKIKELNKTYADNNYATDVLSFYYGGEGTLGDIAICYEVAEAQAKEHHVSLESELALLLIHGTLHLLGYDHQNEAGIASMDKLQDGIMKLLNYNYRDFKWFH